MPPFRAFLLAGLVAACGLRGAAPAGGPRGPDPSLGAELTAQLDRAADAWNRGDLDRFVADYAADSGTTFVDGRRARHGFAFVREHYRPRFLPGAARDSLRFEEIEVRPLGAEFALVTARFVLSRGGRTTASGPFTLVMQRRPEGWRIIHDHSSSDPR